jgi:hypothetical protein
MTPGCCWEPPIFIPRQVFNSFIQGTSLWQGHRPSYVRGLHLVAGSSSVQASGILIFLISYSLAADKARPPE